jgi:uncharacterized repeat protein (TIGR01451 family)
LIGTYVVTAADVTTGSITNTGTGDSDETPPDDDVLITPVVGSPALTTAKSLTGNADEDASTTVTLNDTLTFTITVTNTGNVPLNNVVVSDPMITPTGGSTPCVTVPVGGTCTLIGTYVVQQSDVDNGSISNTGVGDSDETPPDDETIITGVSDPELTVTKTATITTDNGTPGVADAGDIITFNVTVENTGNEILDNLVVNDPMNGPPLVCAPTTLNPGQVATCTAYTYTVTQTDVDNGGTIDNTATATADDPVDNEVTDDDSTTTPIVTAAPALNTVKALTNNADGDGSGTVTEGDVLTYTVTVTNTGNITLNNVVVSDSLITPTGGTTPCVTVAVGGTCTLIGTYVVTAADVITGSITNTGTGDSDETPPDDDVLITPVGGSPALNTVKTLTSNADGDASGTVTEGDVLTYTVTVTNTGNIPLTNVVVTDSLITPTGGTTPCASVAVGATCTLIGTYVVTAADVTTGSITNTGTGDSDETPPDDDVLITPVVGTPALTTSKALTNNADGDGSGTVTEGDVLTYTVTVTNTGNIPLNNVVVSDPMITPTGGTTPCATVAVGGTCTLIGTYTVTLADVVAGSITNTGTGDSDETPPDDDVLITPVGDSPAIAIDKALTNNADEDNSGNVTFGDTLTYTIIATNVGNVTLTNLVVTDSMITPNSITCTSVLVNQTCILIGTYVVTQQDVDNRRIDNIAEAVSNETGPDPVTDVATVPVFRPVTDVPSLSTWSLLLLLLAFGFIGIRRNYQQ